MIVLSSFARAVPAMGLALAALGAAPCAHAVSFTGSAALTSDYVWRGTSQSQGDAQAQAGLRVAGVGGLYASVWGSGVEFAPQTHASSEFDFTAGWAGALAPDWALDLNLTHYRYPSATVDLNWTEASGTLTWRRNTWLQLGWSPDALATSQTGTYAQLGTRVPLGDAWRLEGAVGHYWLDSAYGQSYSHAQLGVVWAFKAPFELRVTYHDTDHAARTLFPGVAGSRVEAALQASF